MPEGRTMEYSVWRSCERWGMRPPGVEKRWEDCHSWIHAMLLSYDQIRQIEDMKWQAELARRA